MIVAGIMSGTSLDGIDVAIVNIEGVGWKLDIQTLAFASFPYPKDVRRALMGVSDTTAHTGEVSRLNVLLPTLYASAVRKTWSGPLELVGCHGQTIFHQGSAVRYLGYAISSTLQIGDGCHLAEHLQVPVVSDFRMRDMAAGGNGAPLVPYFDYLVYRHARRGRVALNLGGIGNITAIPAAARPEEIVAFDTGPANMVIDQLMGHFSGGRRRYDRGGAFARKGTVRQSFVAELAKDSYYRRSPPKNAGREEYGAAFVARFLKAGLDPHDAVATATAFTAETVAVGIERFAGSVADVIVSGGGVHNRTLMSMLAQRLPSLQITSSEAFGIDPDGKEAIAFAVLARETWRRKPSNLPAATGAKHGVPLGKISWGRS